ncbi:MAG: PAS domain S-box protein [Spirochaetes bacterium]|nr:PAS domain S-box protein [Spirochaetota bacterium]
MLASLASLIAYASIRQLFIAIRKRGSALHFAFCLISLGVFGSVVGNLVLLHTDTAQGIVNAGRIRVLFGGISIAFAPWFASYYTGFRPRTFLVVFSSLALLFMAARLFDPFLLTYSVILDPLHLTLPWQERIAVFNAKTNGWMYVYYAIAFTALGSIYVSSLYQYRKGERRRAFMVLAAVTLLAGAIAHDMVVILNHSQWVLLADFGWLTMVLLLDISLTDDIVRTGEIKKSLVDSEKTLRLSEEKYRLLAENVSDVIWTIDLKLKTTYISPSIEKLLGWTPEEWMELSIDRYLPPESLERMRQKMAEGMGRVKNPDYDRNTFVTFDVEQIRKDGSRVWTEISARFIWDESGKPVGGIGVTRDISERKEAEKLLLMRNSALTAINRLSVDLASLPSGESIHRFLARELKEVSGAEAVSISEYDPGQRQLLVRHIELDESLSANPETSAILNNLLSVLPVDEASYNSIMSGPVQFHKTLSDITFGGVPEQVSELVARALLIDRYIGIAYIYEGTLYGTAALAMKQGKPDPQEDLLRSFAWIAAVSLRKNRAEERLVKSLEEKNVLIKEIHHRVKNNLQVIVSLLSMQGDRLSQPEARSLHEESIARVHSMALIHESIYRAEDFANIDMGPYIRDLVKMLLSTYAMDESGVGISINVKDVTLNVDRAVPCGLLLNELVSNALKHGLGDDGRPGRLDLSFSRSADRYILSVADGGPGMDVAAFNEAEQKTLGLQLIKALARQIGGSVRLTVEDGCSFTIEFPVDEHAHT